jgi:hypothetical protein
MDAHYYSLRLELLRPKLQELLPKPDHVDKALLFAEWLLPVTGVRKDFLPEGYFNVEAKELEKLFGRDYADIKRVLLGEGGVLEVFDDGRYLSIIKDGKKSKDNFSMAYKIKDEYVANQPATLLNEVKVPHADKVSRYLKKDLDKRAAKFDEQCKRLALTAMTRRICKNADNERAWQDAWVLEQRGQCFVNRGKAVKNNTLVAKLDRLAAGHFYGNSQDANGRKHDPITNSWELMKTYLRIDGKPVVEMDFANSQYALLALLIKYPTECYAVLTKQETDNKSAVREVLLTLRELHDQEPVVQEFCRQALAGTLYEWAADQTNSTRDAVKKHFQAAFMSETTECLIAKRKLRFLSPLLTVLGRLNAPSNEDAAYWYRVAEANEDKSYAYRRVVREAVYKPMKRNYVSQLLQRFESRMVVDRISMAAVDFCRDEFQTVHDSFLSSVADQVVLSDLVEVKFAEIGIPQHDHPKVKTKAYAAGYVLDATAQELAAVPAHYVSKEQAQELVKLLR